MAKATIASGASLSGAIDLGTTQAANRIVGIFMPGAWTAAAMTFQASNAFDGTFQDVYDDGGTELSLTVAASRSIGLRNDQSSILGRWRFIRVRSGTAASPVNQGAARVIEIPVL